jgi:hypothetical protein
MPAIPKILHVFLLLLSFYCLTVSSADCNGTHCSECVQPGCGWCAATQTCLPGTNAGPDVGVCLGSWETSCVECSTQYSCIGCSQNLGCTWCSSSETCLPRHFASNASICAQPATHCPCTDYNTCKECNQVPGCAFCDTGDCHDASGLSCNRISCECQNYPTCTTCRDDPACGWCSGLSNCTALPAQCQVAHSCDTHCTMELSCLGCTGERGCGWCPTREACHSIDSTICGVELQTQCNKNCHTITDCNLCIDQGLPCEWCASTHSCVDLGVITNCSTTDVCSVEVCPTMETCDSCLSTPGCGWCERERRCADIAEKKCDLARNCSGYFARGFSVGSFFGGMATMLGLYLVIGILAYFYKKKNPPPPKYEDVADL